MVTPVKRWLRKSSGLAVLVETVKEAVATGYPRDKMYGVWWSGAEPDVAPVGESAKGYNALVFLAPAGQGQVHKDMVKYVYDKGQGTGKKEEIGEVLYNRGMVSAMMGVEAVRRAHIKYGKRPLKGEEVRWGLENLAIDDAAIKKLGPAQIEALDMGRRGLHNEGSELLRERLDGKIELDLDTARRLFTLICALHITS